jgi:hypothetical protein
MLMMTVRRWHSYIGAFIAPTVLFLALTGSLQVFSLHEAHGSYTPPPILVRLSSIHKDQVARLPAHRPAPPASAAHPAATHEDADHHEHARAPGLAVTALKWFFIAVALGLIASTSLGLWMAFTVSPARRLLLGLFALGTALPLLLLILQGGG